MVVDIVQADTKAALIQLAYAHDFSLSRCPSYFLAVAEMFCNLFHRDLLSYKIHNID